MSIYQRPKSGITKLWGFGLALVALAGLAYRLIVASPTDSAPVSLAASESAASAQMNSIVPPASPASLASPAITATPVVRAGGPETSVGSEGYGPHILQALASGDPKQAAAALGWLQACQANAMVENALYETVSLGSARGPVLSTVQAEGRRCQTVTPDITASTAELALIAMRGDMPGAAATYVQAARGQVSTELLPSVREHLVNDAQGGDSVSVTTLASSGPFLGVNAEQVAIYQAAADLLGQDAPWLASAPGGASAPALSATQALAARAIYEAVMKRGGPAVTGISMPAGH